MPSFDVVSQLNLQEVDNALNQARKEVAQRYDFKDTRTVIDWDKKEKISVESADEFKVKAVYRSRPSISARSSPGRAAAPSRRSS